MKCKVCGAMVPENSVYCQKCGRKFDDIGISTKDISLFLKEKLDAADTTEIQQYCKGLIDKVGEQKFKSVEIHRSSLDGMDLTDLVYEKGNRLCIKCQDSEDYLKLAAALLINESDSRQTDLNDMRMAFHDDRMAKLKTAYTQYKRAMLTKDNSRKVKQLDDASNTCILGMNELKKEIKQCLDLFERLPKSTVGKLFCGIKLQAAETTLAQIQEAFPWYCDAVRLLMSIDMQNKEAEKVNKTVEEERASLRKMIESKGYRRLLEVDADNAEVWDEYVNHLEVDMYCVEKFIETDTITIKILEEKHE